MKTPYEMGKELFELSAKGYIVTDPWESLSFEQQSYYIDSARVRHEYNKDLDGGCRDINLHEGESLLPEKHACEYRCKD